MSKTYSIGVYSISGKESYENSGLLQDNIFTDKTEAQEALKKLNKTKAEIEYVQTQHQNKKRKLKKDPRRWNTTFSDNNRYENYLQIYPELFYIQDAKFEILVHDTEEQDNEAGCEADLSNDRKKELRDFVDSCFNENK